MESQSIGTRIKQRRNELGLKQLQIKELTGISSGSLSDIENGKELLKGFRQLDQDDQDELMGLLALKLRKVKRDGEKNGNIIQFRRW